MMVNKVSELPVAAQILYVWLAQIVPNTSYVYGESAANAAVNYYSKHAGNLCMQQSPFTWPFGKQTWNWLDHLACFKIT